MNRRKTCAMGAVVLILCACLPVAAQALASSGRYDAVVALGAVIRGETPHFEYVSAEAARGLAEVSLKTGVPVAFGVLTTEDFEQASDRAGGGKGNKGEDAAYAAVETALALKSMK